ncbi:SOUL heme-binding protein [Rubripirellula lacrimiformis]|uniref:SOUL heme-binding protein n=1 Tax=Rubripirellula lacrimiformis TaxID=1930273 RepID=A0A517NCD3_9BACT|nr:heme-binding protein [Rubripirellula lacrimiformis]QDT04789.1 SOUL heme-binding protein [Rubripirellula lacrimiformis]
MMRKKMLYVASVAVLVTVGVFVFGRSTRAGYESAEYKVIESDGKFEVREYPDLMLVATTTEIDAEGRDGSFMKLFGYISGANESEQKISMTTPVFMENDKADSEAQMGFVMPKDVAAGGVPVPTGADVDVRKRSGGRFAVLRFSGRINAKLAKESEAKLRQWMKSKGLVAADDPGNSGVEAASYDPPFTPGPLRRNEVLIRLQTPAPAAAEAQPSDNAPAK